MGGKWQKKYNREAKRGDQSGSVGSVGPPNTWFGGEEGWEYEIPKSEYSLMGFGKYRDWAYGEIMKNKPNYVTYLRQECMESSEGKQQFQQ